MPRLTDAGTLPIAGQSSQSTRSAALTDDATGSLLEDRSNTASLDVVHRVGAALAGLSALLANRRGESSNTFGLQEGPIWVEAGGNLSRAQSL
mmetsp:Transcript_72036/g.146131  ORF Transcript_72036/g.146131 Transcript_72036/m.146131 type:complete len:93 (+) Transcript_72036:158-436(+)